MSVRNLNFFEQHAGKLFLSAVILVSLLLCWLYVLGDPVTVQVGGRQMALAGIEAELVSQSRQLQEKVAADAPIVPVPGIPPPIKAPAGLEDFKPDDPPPSSGRRYASLGHPQPGSVVDEPIGRPIRELPVALLAAPSKPVLNTGQGVARVWTRDAAGKFQSKDTPLIWVAGYTQIPYDSIRAFDAELRQMAGDYAARIPEGVPLLLEVRMQRRQTDEQGRPTGEVQDVPRFGNAPATEIWRTTLAFPGRTDTAKLTSWKNLVERFRRDFVGTPDIQNQIRRPRPYELASGTWEVLGVRQEEEQWRRQQEERTRQPFGPPDPFRPDGAPVITREFDPNAPDPVEPRPFDRGGEVVPGPIVPGVEGGMFQKPAPDPTRDSRIGVYAVDETVRSATRYSYRMQYVIFNPAVNQGLIEDETQEHLVGLESPWSPWSDPIQTEKDLYVFVARSAGPASDAPLQADVFRREWGLWFRSSYEIEIGKPLGGRTQARGGPQKTQYNVDFSTGLIPVDIRRDVTVTVRRSNPGAPPVLEDLRTVEVVFADPRGQLTTRNLVEDMNSPELADKLAQISVQNSPPPPPPTEPSPVGPGPMPPDVTSPWGAAPRGPHAPTGPVVLPPRERDPYAPPAGGRGPYEPLPDQPPAGGTGGGYVPPTL